MLRQNLRNRRRQRRLAMIDVPDRPDVYVRLAAIKFFLTHDVSPYCQKFKGPSWRLIPFCARQQPSLAPARGW
jgi:hypothetical protein